MVFFIKLLPFLLLTGCFGSPRTPKNSRIDKNGEEIINSFTLASDWMMYIGIIAMIAGFVFLVGLKMAKTGGQCIIAGFGCFMFAQILESIGTHLYLYMAFFGACMLTCGLIYHKAITVGLPWLEKWSNRDWNSDGHIGTVRVDKLDALEEVENV